MGTLCALTSPFVVLHWLLRIVNIKAIEDSVSRVAEWVDPFNHAIEFFVTTPPIHYSGEQYATTQGFFAVLLLLGFITCNFFAELLKAKEQRQLVEQSQTRQQNIMDTRQAQQTTVQNRMSQNYDVYLHIQYDDEACQTGKDLIHQLFKQYNAEMMQYHSNNYTLRFPDIESALSCCNQVTEKMLAYYATLRPIDPQPPFKFNLHSAEKTAAGSAIDETQKLGKFVDDNQILFSDAIKSMIEAKQLQGHYQYQSVGIYASSSGGKKVELFRLYTRKVSA